LNPSPANEFLLEFIQKTICRPALPGIITERYQMTELLFSIPPSRTKIVVAFVSVYFFWGATFLGMRFAIETIPVFLMAGTRHLVAGILLFGWASLRGDPKPTLTHWKSATVIGGLLLVCGNGAVAWSEQHIPSGLAALMVATIPLWMILLNWWRHHSARPGLGLSLGIISGFAGTALLVVPGKGAGHVDLLSALVLMGGSIAWASGSLYSRRAKLPSSPLQGVGMQMIAGGVLLLLLATGTGEWARLQWHALSLRSLLSLAYLIVFGSLVGFTAYIWLLKVSTPALVSTYAYVNPVIAVLIGWAFAGEPLTFRTILATAIIITAVLFITLFQTKEVGRGSEETLLPAEECPALPDEVVAQLENKGKIPAP
jgi:drug/metabolite transporter (DMT)-like permease